MDDAALRGPLRRGHERRRRATARRRTRPPPRPSRATSAVAARAARCRPPFHTSTDARVTSATASARASLQRHRGLTRARGGAREHARPPDANIRGDLAHPARAERVLGRPGTLSLSTYRRVSLSRRASSRVDRQAASLSKTNNHVRDARLRHVARIFPSVVRVDQTEMARDTAPAPDLQRAPSLRNSTEEDGLRRALEIVKRAGDRYKNHHTHGLSPLNFFLGLLNVGLSAFILGRAPEFYWAWATLKSVVYLGQSWRVKLAERKRLYLLDLCWVLSFAYTIATTAAFVAWVSPGGSAIRASLTSFTSSPVAFRAIFALANGPLGAATVALGNALVLHSATQTAALFIHISPPIVTWALRWHAPAHAAAFGHPPRPRERERGARAVPRPRPPRAHPLLRVVARVHRLVARARPRRHGHVSKSKHDTVYHSTLCNPKLGKPAGFDPKDPREGNARGVVHAHARVHQHRAHLHLAVVVAVVRRAHRVRVGAPRDERVERRQEVFLHDDHRVREGARETAPGVSREGKENQMTKKRNETKEPREHPRRRA